MEAILGYLEILETVRYDICEKDDVAAKKKYFKARCLFNPSMCGYGEL